MAKLTVHCIVSVLCLMATTRAADDAPLVEARDNAALADSLCAQYPKLCAEIVARAATGGSEEREVDKRASFVRLGKRASFVRLGKRASFVRLGKRVSSQPDSAEDVQTDDGEVNKRASFVRLGKRASFVRLG